SGWRCWTARGPARTVQVDVAATRLRNCRGRSPGRDGQGTLARLPPRREPGRGSQIPEELSPLELRVAIRGRRRQQALLRRRRQVAFGRQSLASSRKSEGKEQGQRETRRRFQEEFLASPRCRLRQVRPDQPIQRRPGQG